MSKNDGQMFEGIRHLFATNLKEARNDVGWDETGGAIEEILGKLNEVAVHLEEAIDEASEAADIATNCRGEISRVVAGQLESYLIGHLKAWINDRNQPGSIASLKEFLDSDEWKEGVEEAKKKINEKIEIGDFGKSMVISNLPKSFDPYETLLQYCENVEHEGGGQFRLDGVYPDTKKDLLKLLNSLKESKINEIVSDIEGLPDAQLYVEREKLNSNLSKASPSDKKLFAEKRIVALNAEIQKRGLSESKINEDWSKQEDYEDIANMEIDEIAHKLGISFRVAKEIKEFMETKIMKESKINEQLPNEDLTEPHLGNEAPDKIDAPKVDAPTGDEEEEPVIDQSKIKEVPPSGEEKEYLGSKGSDMYFYIKTVYGNAGVVEDLLLLDASENQLLAAKEMNIDPTKVIDFILVSIKKAEITLISVDMIEKYILEPKAEEEEEKAEAEKTEETGKDLERQTPAEEPAAITTPETLPTEQPTEFRG